MPRHSARRMWGMRSAGDETTQGLCPLGVYVWRGADPHTSVSWATLGPILQSYKLRIWGLMETE